MAGFIKKRLRKRLMEQALNDRREICGQQRSVFPVVEQIKRVGVLYLIECQDDIRDLEDMVRWLAAPGMISGSKSTVLAIETAKCFRDVAQRESFLEEINGCGVSVEVGIVGKKQLNRIGVPQNEAIESFIQQKFDLLLVMNEQGNFTLEFLALKADADFVAAFGDQPVGHYNMVLSSGKKVSGGNGISPKEYLQQFFHYLGRMNQEPEE